MFCKSDYMEFFRVLHVSVAWLFDVKCHYKPVRRTLNKMGSRQEKETQKKGA